MTQKRDYFVQLLREAGFDPIVPEGSYFMVADWSKVGEYRLWNTILKYFVDAVDNFQSF